MEKRPQKSWPFARMAGWMMSAWALVHGVAYGQSGTQLTASDPELGNTF